MSEAHVLMEDRPRLYGIRGLRGAIPARPAVDDRFTPIIARGNLAQMSTATGVLTTTQVVGSSVHLCQPRVITGALRAAPADPEPVPVPQTPLASLLQQLLTHLTDSAAQGDEGKPRASAAIFMLALTIMTSKAATVPTIFTQDDGELGLKWKANGRFVSVSVPPDGNLVAYAAGPGWDVFEIDEPVAGAPIEQVLHRIQEI